MDKPEKDIVERLHALRHWEEFNDVEGVAEEVAKEIERLRSTLARVSNAIGSGKYSRSDVKDWIREALQ